MTDEAAAPESDAALLRALCEEARNLAGGLRGSVSRLTLRAADHAVEIEWGAVPGPPAQGAAAGVETGAVVAAGEEDSDVGAEGRYVITAPLVGFFYRCPEPGAKPFVEEGDVVEAGQDVAIVEAMKIMNRVQADRPGRVVKILAEDGHMVEFGQDLMVLEPSDAGA